MSACALVATETIELMRSAAAIARRIPNNAVSRYSKAVWPRSSTGNTLNSIDRVEEVCQLLVSLLLGRPYECRDDHYYDRRNQDGCRYQQKVFQCALSLGIH